MENKKDFNGVIVGVGGQGQITLLQVLAEAALFDGYDVKTSELHGLSQRGGSVEVHIRLGKQIHSPLVGRASADFILGLEMQECLKASYYADSETVFLINKFLAPIFGQNPLAEKKIIEELKKITSNVFLVPASDICQKELDTGVVAGVYMLTIACFKNFIPVNPESILKAIKKIIPERHLALNKKTFELARNNAEN